MLRLLLPLAIAALWVLASNCGTISPLLLPEPLKVFGTFTEMLLNGELIAHICASFIRAMSGYALAAFVGIGLGFACSTNHRVDELVYLPAEALRLTPPLALVPLLILWLGINEAPKIAVVFLSGFFPIFFNTATAVRGVDHKLLEVAAILKFSRREVFQKIILPASAPGILTGLRLGFGYCWRALVGAELIAASSGLGFMISEAGEMVKTDVVFVGILTIILLGVMMDRLLLAAIRKAGGSAP